MRLKRHKWLLLVPISLVTLFFGCDSTGTDGKQSSLSLSVVAENGAQSLQKQSVSMQNNHVTITNAKMLIRRIEFKSDIEDDGVADDSLDFQTDPLVLALNIDGTLNEVAVKAVPSGSYDEIEFDVHKPEDNETPPDPDFKIGDSGDERFSIIIEGTYEGQDFLYRSTENMEQELELASPLTINEDTETLNVTLTVDLSKWFVDENNNELSPINPDNENAIDESIKRSFENIFEDNDRDGEED